MKEAELPRERKFEDINNEKEPSTGPDEVFFGEGEGEKVDRHDGARGIGDHR